MRIAVRVENDLVLEVYEQAARFAHNHWANVTAVRGGFDVHYQDGTAKIFRIRRKEMRRGLRLWLQDAMQHGTNSVNLTALDGPAADRILQFACFGAIHHE